MDKNNPRLTTCELGGSVLSTKTSSRADRRAMVSGSLTVSRSSAGPRPARRQIATQDFFKKQKVGRGHLCTISCPRSGVRGNHSPLPTLKIQKRRKTASQPWGESWLARKTFLDGEFLKFLIFSLRQNYRATN